MAEQPAPLSEEDLAALEGATWNPLGVRLVAEVWRLRAGRLAEAAACLSDLERLKAAHDAEVVRLRGLLRKYGDHTVGCPTAWVEGPCRCGWTDIERELDAEEANGG